MINLDRIYIASEKIKYKKQMKLLNKFNSENIPNIIFYGSNSSGKKNILRDILKLDGKRKICRTFNNNNKKVEYTLYYKDNIFEIDLNELILYKNVFFKTVLVDLISTKSVDQKNKIFIIHGIEQLMKKEQYILRKIMEDYVMFSRFILLTTNIDKLLEPIKSRCLCIRLEGFSKKEIIKANNKQNKILNSDTIKDVKLNKYLLTELSIEIDNYKDKTYYIDKMYDEIITFICNKKLVRDADVKMMNKNIFDLNTIFDLSFSQILKDITSRIIKKKRKIFQMDKHRDIIYGKLLDFEIRINNSSKELIHIEAFIYFIKNYLYKLS